MRILLPGVVATIATLAALLVVADDEWTAAMARAQADGRQPAVAVSGESLAQPYRAPSLADAGRGSDRAALRQAGQGRRAEALVDRPPLFADPQCGLPITF